MAEASDDKLVGQLIDRRYRVLRKLGGGGMGTVYEVEHSLLLDRRALKLIKLELAQEPGYRQRFFREAQWLNQSRHPHIVAVHDFQDDPEHGLFIVMELVVGPNLKALLQERGRLAYAEVLRIGREVALALEHVHRLGRVHRDVKPANILVEEGSGRAVVTDFGIAKDLGSTGEETLTQTHEVVGTLNYASPEQIGGDKDSIDERSDIYSLGAVLFEMYAGRHYGGIGSVSRLKYPEPPPEDFRILVRGCLELDTERRTASVTEVIQQLEACAQALRAAAGGATVHEELAARGSSSPAGDSPTAAAAEATRATVVGAEIGVTAPPSGPTEGTATIQQREAQDLRRQVLRAQVDELHREIDGLRGQCLELQRHLSAFGVSAAGFTAVETLAEQLADVEQEPDLERQRARLEALIGELGQAQTDIQGILRDAAEEAVRGAQERLDQLADQGEAFVAAADVEPLRNVLATARGDFAARRWNDGHAGLEQALLRMEEARAAARSRAAELVGQILAAAESTIGEMEGLVPPGGEMPGLEAARAEASALLDRGEPQEARAGALRLAEEARQRLATLVAARDQARALGEQAEAQRLALDPGVEGVAGAALGEARAARQRGEAAQARRDFAGASEQFAREAELYREAAAVLERARAERAAALRNDLERVIQHAAAAPPVVVADARRAAEEALAAPPSEPTEATEVYARALAGLRAALDEVAPYEAASEQQLGARSLQEQLAAVGVDAEELRPSLDVLQDADAAYERREWARAASLYTSAGEQLRRVQAEHQLAEEEKAARRAEVEVRLRELLQRAEIAPDELVGAARTAAQTLLESERPADFTRELTGLVRASEDLRQALEQESAYDEAVACRADAGELRRGLDALELQQAELQPIDRLLQEAEDAFRQRRWDLAAKAYTGAAEQTRRLEAECRRRQQAERVAAGRVRAEEERARAEAADAGEVAPEPFQRVEGSWREAQQAEERGDLDGALELYARAAAAYGDLAVAAEESWAERLARAEGEVAAAIEAALAEEEALVGIERDAAAALLRGEGPTRTPDRCASLEHAGAVLQAAVAQRADHDAAVAARAEATAGFARVEPLTRVAGELEPARQLMTQAQTALSQRDWTAAGTTFARVVAELARLEVEFHRREQREQALETRRAAEGARTGVDLDAAMDLAPAQAERANALLAKGVEAEQQGHFVDAKESYTEAAAAFEDLAGTIEEARRAERARAEEALRAALAGAESLPGELADQARSGAEELLTGACPAPYDAEIAALRQSAAGLDHVVQQLPTYLQAVEVRQEVVSARERVFALEPKKKQRRPIETGLKEAAELEGAGDWSAALETYTRTHTQLEGLEQALREKKPGAPIFTIAAATVAAAAVGAALFIYQPWKTETATAPKQRSEAELERKSEGVEVAAKPPVAQAPAEAKPELNLKPEVRAEPQQPQPATEEKIPEAVAPQAKVNVAAVNHPPSIVDASPKPGRPIVASIGDTLNLRATATDADNDPLTYAWTVDGKPAGENKPALDLKVSGPHEIALTTTDGQAVDTQKWKVGLSALKLDAVPAKLDRVRFDAAQEFALTPPPGQSAEGLKVAWAVDSQKISDGPKFVFKADDPRYVRPNPIKVAATATNDRGQSFSREWKFSVQPPVPVLEKSTPAGSEVSGDPGTPLRFEVVASRPIGGQQITYAFSVDGREQQKGANATFTLTPSEDQDLTVTAKIEDNYQQAPPARTWKVQVSGITGRAKEWLDQYERAFQSRNAGKVAELRGLGTGDVQKLQRAFAAQNDLQVSFRAAKVERLDGNRSRVSYEMTQSFTGPDGRAQRSVSSCSHVLSFANGRLTDTSQTPCSRLE